ncbi:MAG: CHASE2 domain-containing protein, partial [Elusimicrobia bacterium]|nr:CHASE2 domain-containing protein [Elusimicrobiota bacterium]
MAKKTSWLLSELIIGFIVSALVAGMYFGEFSFFEGIEYKLYDLRAKFRQTKKANPDIVIVTIDDQSITNIGRWPWPRSVIAGLVDKLASTEPKVIGLNILFTEPDRNQGLEEIRYLKQQYVGMMFKLQRKLKAAGDKRQMSEFLEAMSISEEAMDNDTILSNSIADAGNVVLPMFFAMGVPLTSEAEEIPELLSNNILSNIEETATSPAGQGGYPAEKGPDVTQGHSPVIPYELFGEVAGGIGHSNLTADSDGVIRRAVPVIYSDGKYYPSFVMQLVRLYRKISLDDIKVRPGKEITFGNARIPLGERMAMLIDYAGPVQTYPYYSVFDVLTDKIPPEVFKNKIIIVGYMATGLADLNVVPIGHNFPGTEIIANTLQNILEQKFISRPAWARSFEIGSLLFCAVLVTFLISRLKAQWSSLISAVVLLAIFAFGTYMFVKGGQWVKISYPSLLLLVGYTVIISRRFLLTEKRKELVEAESIETNKMLGLSFQGQGMLDLAFEKFRKCPVDDTVKELLYNLGLDFERKRQFNKAVAVYEHVQSADPKYKDIANKTQMLKSAGEGAIFGTTLKKTKGETVILEGAAAQTPTLGRYEIVKELGHGAMGTVYLGKDPKINRMVAVKTVRFEDDVPEEEMKSIKQRFFREAESAGKLAHPNIIRIFDAGEDYDVSYIAMELLEGGDLKDFCAKDKLLPIRDAVNYVIKVADALDYAHQQGVVHRDIKPANIMHLKDGSIRVTDFGIARIMASSKTQTGTVLGTPSYMSPEQISGKKVDGRADLFSLGVVLYELLTGEKPFQGDNIATLLFQIANENPPDPKTYNPAIPDCLAPVIDRALRKDPEKRYQRGQEMVADL